MKFPLVCLAAHDWKLRRWVDFRKCQTATATPAKPGVSTLEGGQCGTLSATAPQGSQGELVVNGTLSSQLIAPVSTGFAAWTDLFSELQPSIDRFAGTRNRENGFRIRLPFPLFAATAADRVRFGSRWRSSGRSRFDGVGRRTAVAATQQHGCRDQPF